ncbi:MAG: hypothetical protein ACU0CC_12440 [Sagittula sp.]|jgi:uncharacterized protein YjiS (DUF1127 family)|uniref:hypothetical protein n=1 Tax=unclassified Sagittula TaxID=2624628 RepID=UPI000C2CE4F6|nr:MULTISPECIES: hypothetical protein [unclassified Sagittula]AUC54825.1 hypothetical protein CDO87_17320 [Sagittula sp. P11]WHZ33813.1 hypothetical protein QNI11_14325 [Sagittula sp. MA-2]
MTRDNVQVRIGHVSLYSKIDWFLAERGLGFNPGTLRRARLREIIQLETLSDSDLERIGLTRDDILPHVFRDLFHA